MISNKDKFLIFMSMNEISNKKQEMLIKCLNDFSLENVLNNQQLYQILSEDEINQVQKSFHDLDFDNIFDNLQRSEIKILTIFSQYYPKSLIDLPDRPLLLYAKGNLSLLEQKCFAIVGTRMPTAYGKIVTEKFAKMLAESGLVIVSGLCYGVDQIAHKATLAVKGKTIGVIASGLNRIYPSINTNLANEIIEKGGLIISEYPPSFQAKKYTFPRRNRIVAGLCDGILITEAGLKSGTVHTKEFALEYGKDIFAIPGNINNSKSDLPNYLIKTAQADCVVSPQDIIERYGLQNKSQQNKMLSLSFDEQTILSVLERGECNFDFLAEKSKIPVNILNSCLTTLEIRGLIRRLPAQMICLA